jgi:predicted dehydrogenase
VNPRFISCHGDMAMADIVRLGLVGARRGRAFSGAVAALSERIRVTALCDINNEALAAAGRDLPDAAAYKDYSDMLDSDVCDAVFVATPLQLHARQAIQALEAGKHVLSEVTAAYTLDECWDLVRAVERSGRVYMLAENYCYMRPNMMIRNMAEHGVFGEITHAEGAYIHDCRGLMFDAQGRPTWRWDLLAKTAGNTYPTHSLGPVSQWMGVNKPGGDRLISTTTYVSQAASRPRYAAGRLGGDHPAAARDAYARGDSATTLIQTERGAVIVLRVDTGSVRPHNMTHYVLQGTQASYVSPRTDGERHLIWIEGRSPATDDGIATEWEDLWRHADEFEHPYWREWGAVADAAGHGGGDFFVIYDFARCILEGAPAPIDVYDAVTWSSIIPLSQESVRRGGAAIAVPDFASGQESRRADHA